MTSIFEKSTQSMGEINKLSQKDKIIKIMTLFKVYSTMKILKEDNKPVELVDNLFIGSIGAASNKKALQENKITHIVVAGAGLKQLYPNDFKYLQFELLDSETEDIKKHFIDAGKFIDDALKNGGKVMVHW